MWKKKVKEWSVCYVGSINRLCVCILWQTNTMFGFQLKSLYCFVESYNILKVTLLRVYNMLVFDLFHRMHRN